MASAEAPERVRHLLADSESTAEENQVLHEKKKKKHLNRQQIPTPGPRDRFAFRLGRPTCLIT